MLWGMGFWEALDHAFSTIATGGFSTRNENIAYYHSFSLEMILTFFMVISSSNFGLYVDAWKRGLHVLLQDTEFKVYLLMVAAAVLLTPPPWCFRAISPSGIPPGSPLPVRLLVLHHRLRIRRLRPMAFLC